MKSIPIFCSENLAKEIINEKSKSNVPKDLRLMSFQGKLVESSEDQSTTRFIGSLSKEFLTLSHQKIRCKESYLRQGPILVIKRDSTTGVHSVAGVIRNQVSFDERPTPITPPQHKKEHPDDFPTSGITNPSFG